MLQPPKTPITPVDPNNLSPRLPLDNRSGTGVLFLKNVMASPHNLVNLLHTNNSYNQFTYTATKARGL